METRKRWALRFAAFLLWIPIVLQATAAQSAQTSTREIHGPDENNEDILTLDHFVPHISTVPANRGEQVELFVRERVRADEEDANRHSKPVVLMIQPANVAAVPTYDLPFENYSWMAFLAEQGFDAFAMDLTGHGRSPRPKMDDPCNTSRADQEKFLIPNPLPEPCSPSYAFTLSSIKSDWDEIDTVVDHIRELRGVDKVNLLGWSRAGPRIGGYTVRHPEKVERLFLLASRYIKTDPSEKLSEELPEPGFPMHVLGSENFFKAPLSSWDDQLKCPNQFTPPIRDTIRSSYLENDELGAMWGSAGVRRSPNQGTLFGLNPMVAGQIRAPTLVIVGDNDAGTQPEQSRNLYTDLLADSKVFVHVACASHFFVWENQHLILLRASAEWLRNGTFAGQQTGSFFVDTDGGVHQE